jgi:pSer/pThr/pTyr-binding forkhead associated (FHA) protein/type II secretory pathway predicted ATPase ExeA
MDLGAAGLNEQPFRTHGKPLSVILYASHRQALRRLEEVREVRDGLCLVQGPALSGKSTLVRAFVDSVAEDVAVAVVDARGLDTAQLLEAIVTGFGYVMEQSSVSEFLAMLRVFCLQQASSNEPPILIIENTQSLNPNALQVLCELAELNARAGSAIKIILVSDRSLTSVIQAPATKVIKKRLTHNLHMHPMTRLEATEFLYNKLRAAGSQSWPGILDRVALLALSRADKLPVTARCIEHPALPRGTWAHAAHNDATEDTGSPPGLPELYVTHNGQTLSELCFDRHRFLIGRSQHNDIPISSNFVSRHHAMLVRNDGATFLMDLNSTNGTFVNSKRVSIQALIHEDIISIGNHRIKFSDPSATSRRTLEAVDVADTVIMKTLEDMRKLLTNENTQVIRTATENLPTSGI